MGIRSGLNDIRGNGALSANSLWPHSQGHLLSNIGNSSEIRSQGHYEYHMESAPTPSLGKRRHRLSPLR